MERGKTWRVKLSGEKPAAKVNERLLERVAFIVFEKMQISPRGTISVSFLDQEAMRTVKRQFFHEDIDTDVISFLYGEEEIDKVWGEILICLPVAFEQARERKKTFESEVLFLFIHGLLHLLGYRDDSEEERKRMDEEGQKLFAAFEEEEVRKKLIEKAERAKARAYAPYSRFRVGAALLASQGEIFIGCNVENASLGLTICAERVAVVKAVSSGVRTFEKIAIISDSGSSLPFPCGACRQLLFEFAPQLEVIVASSAEHFQVFSLPELLPHAFRFEEDSGGL